MIVEIGSYEGRSTLALAAGSACQNVFSIDPHSGDITEVLDGKYVDTFRSFLTNLESAGLSEKISVVRARSEEAGSIHAYVLIGLLFVDGWHTGDAVKRDIDDWVPKCGPSPIIIFDDWADAEIFEAISARRSMFPKYCLAVGKDLLFSDLAFFQSFSF